MKKFPRWCPPLAHAICIGILTYVLASSYVRDQTSVEQVLMLFFMSWNISTLLKLGQDFIVRHVKIGKIK